MFVANVCSLVLSLTHHVLGFDSITIDLGATGSSALVCNSKDRSLISTDPVQQPMETSYLMFLFQCSRTLHMLFFSGNNNGMPYN